jgi:hypothetical protein
VDQPDRPALGVVGELAGHDRLGVQRAVDRLHLARGVTLEVHVDRGHRAPAFLAVLADADDPALVVVLVVGLEVRLSRGALNPATDGRVDTSQ